MPRPELRAGPVLAAPAQLPLEQRWYAPLLRPVRRRVRKILRRLERGFPELGSAAALPRAGLASALLFRLCDELGSRRTPRRAVRDAATWFEFYNAKQFGADPRLGLDQRRRLYRFHLDRASRLWTLLRRFDDSHGRAVLALAVGLDARFGEGLPEAEELLRAVAAAAALLGRIELGRYRAASAALVWLGSAWEAARQAAAAPPQPAWEHPLGGDCRASAAALAAGQGVLQGRRQVARGEVPEALETLLGGLPGEPDGPWLGALLATQRGQLRHGVAGLDPAVAWLVAQPGKRLRALLCWKIAEHVRRGAGKDALPGASLLIDDVIDAARTRRHQPCLHVLTGADFALGFAAFVLLRVYRTSCTWPGARHDAWLAAVEALAEGERREVAACGDFGLRIKDCTAINGLKTAGLFAAAARLGALAAGASGRRTAELAAFGHGLGLAFQIADDLLDLRGDPRASGKARGMDLRSGKLTIPLALLRDRLPRGERRWLRGLFEGGAEDAELTRVAALLERYDVPRAALTIARAGLPPAPDPGLEKLARACLERGR